VQSYFSKVLGGLIHLFYPNTCLGCRNGLLKSESYLCISCLSKLPYTQFHLQQGNLVEKCFWGRVPLHQAFSYLYFRDKGMTRNLLHRIKYQGDKELATHLGFVYGSRLKEDIPELYYDGILAVPLHPARLRKRGFNQSHEFAEGLSAATAIPNLSHLARREVATSTQTRKNRESRWLNVDSIFSVNKQLADQNHAPHFLLVDDVITTGATMESFAASVLNVLPDCRLSVASIAYAV